MRKVFTLTFVCFLGAICAGATKAQERPIDFSSRGANVLGAPGAQSLSLPSRAAPAAVVATFLGARGFLPETVASLVVKKAGRVSRTGITHLRFAQEVEGLTVYGTYVKAAVNDAGELVHLIENLATPSSGGLMPTAISESTALDAALDEVHPEVAVSLLQGPRDGNATRFSGDDFFYRNPTVTRVAIPMASGVLEEGFLVETWTEEGNLLHHTLIDGTGRVLQVELRTNNDSYNIFPENPDILNSQTEVAGPGIIGNAESPDGWLDIEADGVTLSAQSSIDISGNNAHAYLDVNIDNGADPSIDFSISNGNFVTVARPEQQPNSLINQEVAVQNLFYFNNFIHDMLYFHGFDEAAGNFQENNFGKGGSGNDAVLAEAQDGGGFNNANFATPPDGPYPAPRMQMYLWNPSAFMVEIGSGDPIYDAVGALFGPSPTGSGLMREVVIANDNDSAPDGGTPTDGCEDILNVVSGKIALIDRGLCNFVVKVQNAQNAGAAGVIVVNNVLAGIGAMADNGDGVAITIPSLFVSMVDGAEIKEALADGTVAATLKATQLMRDGDVDSDIILHEYGHGLTWRMIGGMTSDMSGAIGEGMSDVLAILINNDDVVGEYSTGDSIGIRSRPYSGYSDDRTYGDFTGSSVHFDGEIYAAAVWRVWELFKDKYPTVLPDELVSDLFDYLIDGMNYTPSNPTMEEMRDGILMSAAGSDDACVIWEGFAELGIGVGAAYAGGTVTESMALPAECGGAPNTTPTVTIVDPAGTLVVTEGESVAFAGTASDNEQGILTASLAWTSDLDGAIGSKGSFSTTALSVGVHNITASVTDIGGLTGSANVGVTVNAGADPGLPADPDYFAAANAVPPDGTAVTNWEHIGGNDVTGFEIRREKKNKKGMWKGRTTVAAVAPDDRSYVDASGNGTFHYQVRALNGLQASDWMPSVWVEIAVTTDGGTGGGGGRCNGKGNKPGCP